MGDKYGNEWLCMKTTIEISDDLMRRARQLALDRDTTLRAVVEEGLQMLLGPTAQAVPSVRFTTYGSAKQALSAQALERVRREMSSDAMLPDDPDWWKKRFGFLPAGMAKE